MYNLFLLVVLQLNLIHSINLSDLPSLYIINGQEATVGEFPHQLLMERLSGGSVWKFSCGAVLINPHQALTAAHCVDKLPRHRYRVVAGLIYKSQPHDNQTVMLEKIVIHPGYNDSSATNANDIAVLTFKTPLRLNHKVQPITWNQNNNITFAGDRCMLSGWGKTITNNYPDVLQRVKMDVISNKNCLEKLKANMYLYPGHICAYELVHGAGTGDSGGPMTCERNGKDILVGITSWGVTVNGACSTQYPTVYARVSHFKRFILANISH